VAVVDSPEAGEAMIGGPEIATPEYWDRIYSGAVKAEPGGHESDRFQEVLRFLTLFGGDKLVDIGAGYAQLCRRIKKSFQWTQITAVDFSDEARARSGYTPYVVASAYDTPFLGKEFDVAFACQILEYLEDNDRFLIEAKRIARALVVTVPKGMHPACSQLRQYDAAVIRALLEPHAADVELGMQVYEKGPLVVGAVRFA
jgi:ubiquinone/menaquinone biosynthesis C-methylase UbiE